MEEIQIQRASGRGSAWLGGGFELFKLSPGVWIGTLLIMVVIQVVLALIPFIGSLASSILGPVFQAGWLLASRKLDQGEEFNVGDMFGGFRSERFGQLVMVGVLYLVGMIVIGAVIGGSFVVVSGGAGGNFHFGPGLMLVIALGVTLVAVLLMSFAFAPALVLFRNLPAFAAFQTSFSACWTNMGPLLVYGLLTFLMMIVALIPLGLGLLVALPVMIASGYCAYTEIFPEAEADDAPE